MSDNPPTPPTSPGFAAMAAWEQAKHHADALYVEYLNACREKDRIYQEVVKLGRQEGWHV